MEGNFEGKPRGRSPERANRVKPKKQPDNLKLEGEFQGKPKDSAPKGERPKQKKYSDNLKMDGEFITPDHEKAPKGERAPINEFILLSSKFSIHA